MMKPGKMREIADEMDRFKIDLAALQEIRWKDTGIIKKEDYIVYYSCSKNRTGQYGTGFMVMKKLSKCVLGFTPTNERLCSLRIKGKFNNITVISAHAPTEDSHETEKDYFYDKLEEICNNVSGHDTVLILSDFNAKIGKEVFAREVAGQHSLHDTTSPNGERLCHLASGTSTYIVSTHFPHKNIHKGTWKVPGSSTVNQIDHVLVSKRWMSSILDVRACRAANCDSDHYMIRIKIRQRISNVGKNRGQKRNKYDTDKLKDENTLTRYRNKIEEQLNNIQQTAQANNSINQEWENLSKTLVTCTMETRTAIKKRVEEINSAHNSKSIRKFYANLKHEKAGFQPKLINVKDKDGIILTEKMQILNRWKQYFQELLNTESREETTQWVAAGDQEERVDEPSMDEVLNSIDSLKAHKSPGEDSITTEMIKNAGSRFHESVNGLVRRIWSEEIMPENWNVAFKQAFDSIKRNTITTALSSLGIPSKLIRLVMMTLNGTKARVMVQNEVSEVFTFGAGVKQGDTLSPTIFNLVLHYAIRHLYRNGNIIYRSTQIGAYADDIIIMVKRLQDLKEIFTELEESCLNIGLTINENKTKYLKVSRSNSRRTVENIVIGRYNFEGVSEFSYLGAQINNMNDTNRCIQSRILAGNKCYYAYEKLFKSKLLTRTCKLQMYKRLIRPAVTYGGEVWTLTVADENMLRIFERKILRKIYGPKQDDTGKYYMRSNAELLNLIRGEDIVRFVKSQRIKWAGHVYRMPEDRLPKSIMRAIPMNTRSRGRPRLRWKDNIEQDLRKVGVTNWRSCAADRNLWRMIVQQVKAHPGL
ncbi:uncharacterized protein LOC129616611 [Condylostylus longicornis]|uniref:uncharacterized protein LOC129616611 n=1 Tax=Condylostylus longicornis TaxID=2530218 RepID=UPI00244E213E|nr:uncharacterized protein LOC129616611 [Condylostylus longicornis]